MSRRARLLLAALLAAAPSLADEGMWTYDNFPSAEVERRYGVKIDQRWLDRVRLASVRIAGCSATFVSPDGLLLTNHHCAESCLAELSSREQSYLEDGFLAAGRAGELRCPTQIAEVLVAMENVTARVAAATQGQTGQAANATRKRTLTELEQACEQASAKDRATGPLKCQAVTLYGGGQYWLYKFRRYDDVRVAFAPEMAIAQFGGDPDNFQFPRWCLDMALLRVYSGGKPLATPDYLTIDFAGPKADDFVAVSGNPGATQRLLTRAELLKVRDTVLPGSVQRGSEIRGRLIQFGKTSEEAARLAAEPLSNAENTLKVNRHQLVALMDEGLLARKAEEQAALERAVQADAQLAARIGDPWSEIAAVQDLDRALHLPYAFLENMLGFNSRLFRHARSLVRAAEERTRPNAERLREYTEAALPRLEQQLTASVPVYPELENVTLSYSLERMREFLGPDHPVVRRVLGRESPETLAARLIGGTRLADPAVRGWGGVGGGGACAASRDPMIELARGVDPEARAVRKRYEDEVEAPVRAATERIADARFAVLGTSVYPDATFSPRLNYGTVRGWTEKVTPIEPFTVLRTAFERATGHEPFRIPERWLAARERLDLDTPFNYATDNDVVGGNSGSPGIDARGRLIGLVFDGNVHSIANSYWFDAGKSRTVLVHPAIMREALAKVYGAEALLAELEGRR